MHILVPSPIRRLARDGIQRECANGAALIVDAEGSTALSARLQPYGTAGAEALAGVLTSVFTPMVEHVEAWDGVVATFAGDGIVAVFPGEPSSAVTRAVLAGQHIVRDLTAAREIDTPDGPARLNVRAVVGFGSVEWSVWTAEDTDMPQSSTYACLGSAVTEAQRGEQVTPGGHLAIGPAARSELHAGVVGTDLPGGFVAIDQFSVLPHGASSATPFDEDSAEADTRFFPVEVVEAEGHGEFRDVVTVFLEFRRIADGEGAAAIPHLLASLAEYGGYLCDVVVPEPGAGGVRCLAFWGAPTSREHDIGYAIRFVDSVRRFTGHDMVRAGLTRSTAFVGFVGSTHQESYTAIGSGVNLAARLCAHADWGDMRIDALIAARLDDPWRLEDLGEVSYRGFEHPVATHRIAYVPPVRHADPFAGGFVGRSEELDELEDMLTPLWSGRSTGIIGVVGSAGSGKSRLIEELGKRLTQREPPPTWLRARADEIGSQPFATLANALTGYFGRPTRPETAARLAAYLTELALAAPDRASELERGRQTLGDLLGIPEDVATAQHLDPKSRFENTVAAVRSLVLAAEATAPVIITVADGQWIDDGTAEVFQRLVDHDGGSRVALVVETREPDAGIRLDRMLEVGPLADDEVAQLFEQISGRPASGAVVSALTARSQGNTFFLRQLLDYLDREHQLESDDEVLARLEDEAEVPIDLRRLLVARLDHLPAPVRRLVQTSAVLGREIDLVVLRAMLPADDVDEARLRNATDSGVWNEVDDTHVAFADLLTRDAAYGMLLQSDARDLHLGAATAIEAVHGSDDRVSAEIAHHYFRAGLNERAASHYIAAGRVAARRFSSREALAHLERALDLLDESDTASRREAWRSIHDVNGVLGDRVAQEAAIAAMEALGGPSADTALLRAQLLSSIGQYAEAEAVVEEASDLGGAEAEAGDLLVVRAQLARYQGRTNDARAHGLAARRRFEEVGDPVRAATANDFLGGIAYDTGDFRSAADLHRAAAAVFRDADRISDEIGALNNLGSALFAIGDYSTARVIHHDGAERSRKIGYRMGEGDHVDNMGGTAWAVGDYDLAIEYYSAALDIREQMDDAWGIAISKGNLGATYRAVGDVRMGVALYREALEIDQRIGRRRGEAYDLHGIGLCHVDLGRHNLASESLERAAAIRSELGEAHLANESHVACALAMFRRGDVEAATELVIRVLDEEGEDFFEGAVETTATRMRCVEVLAATTPRKASALRKRTVEGVAERAARISDPGQRTSYLQRVESHRTANPD